MITFGCSITAPDVYSRCAERGFHVVKESDSEIIAHAAAGSLPRSYNAIMEAAARHEDLEALVLVHQDTELVNRDFCAKVREALRDPDVALVGCVGAIDVRSIAWWEGSVTWASFTHRYAEFGGGEIEPLRDRQGRDAPYARTGEVDALDGFVLVLSPWAVRNLRFDESLGLVHGYDFDYCLQVREAGKKIVTADFKAVHHHSLTLVNDTEAWMDAHVRISNKWHGRMARVGLPNWGSASDDWKQRAFHAEAEAGVARLERVSAEMRAEAREHQLQAALDEVLVSTSWRVTAPLRRLTSVVRARRNGGRA